MDDKNLISQLKKWMSSSNMIDQEIYNSYLAKSEIIKNKDNDFTIVIDSEFGVKLVNQYLKIINNKFKELLGNNVLLNVIPKNDHKKIKNAEKQKLNKQNNIYEFSFDNFIIGESNNVAFEAAKAVVNNPGKYNPLFIYGDSGLGKTHLLKSIDYHLKKEKNLNSIYISSEEFSKKVIDIIHQGHEVIEEFKKQYTQADFLIIDDVQFLAKKEKTNELLFNIFNNFIDNGKQLVFSSDKIPDELNGFDKRLITRFNLGLTALLKSLDFSTALSIINFEIKQLDLESKIDKDVSEYIAKNLSNDVRKIKGSIKKIDFWLLMNPNEKNIDLKSAQELFKDIPTANLGILNIKKIKEIVAEKYNVQVRALDGKARISSVVNARHVAMYLVKQILGHSLSQIGTEFGGRDHTTVMSGINKIETNMAKDKNFKKTIEILKASILSK